MASVCLCGSVPADGVKGKTWGPSTLTSSRSRPNIVDTQGRSVILILILFISVLNLDPICGSASLWCRAGSQFPFWCRSRTGSGSRLWHQYDADPHADPTYVGKSEFLKIILPQHCQITIYYDYLSLLFKGVKIFSFLDSILKFYGKKVKFASNWYQFRSAGFGPAHPENDVDPNPQHSERFYGWSCNIVIVGYRFSTVQTIIKLVDRFFTFFQAKKYTILIWNTGQLCYPTDQYRQSRSKPFNYRRNQPFFNLVTGCCKLQKKYWFLL